MYVPLGGEQWSNFAKAHLLSESILAIAEYLPSGGKFAFRYLVHLAPPR